MAKVFIAKPSCANLTDLTPAVPHCHVPRYASGLGSRRHEVDYHSHIVATLPAVETLGEPAFRMRACADDGEGDESRRASCSFGHASLAATGCWPVSMRSFDFFVSVIADWA